MNLKKIIFIVGPTAVGKTKISLLLAKKMKGEIISCDSMQIYKEVNILSNKASRKVLEEVPHYMIDIVSVKKDFDVASFEKKALASIRKIHGKKKIPIVVGGSGLYMQVLLDGIFEGPKKNQRLRKNLEREIETKGCQSLYLLLQQKDPQAASKIHPNDRRRIVRALEVILTAKKPISQLQKQREGLWGKFDIKIFALNRPRPELYELIDKRVEAMFKEGIVEEIKALKKVKWSKAASSLIGVREVQGYLNGEYNLEKAKELMKLRTRHLAKRQLTWFRADKRIRWVMMGRNNSEGSVISEILKEIDR